MSKKIAAIKFTETQLQPLLERRPHLHSGYQRSWRLHFHYFESRGVAASSFPEILPAGSRVALFDQMIFGQSFIVKRAKNSQDIVNVADYQVHDILLVKLLIPTALCRQSSFFGIINATINKITCQLKYYTKIII